MATTESSTSVAAAPSVVRTSHGWLGVLAFLIGLIPPALVILDRWFSRPLSVAWVRSAWCASSFLCASAWPAYFLLVFACTLLAVGLVIWMGAESFTSAVDESRLSGRYPPALQRRAGFLLIVGGLAGAAAISVRLVLGSGPPGWPYIGVCAAYLLGWLLRTTSLDDAVSWLETRGGVILAQIMGLAATSALLFTIHANRVLSPLLLLLTTVGAVLLYRNRRAVPPSFWLVLMALVLYTMRLNAWDYAWIGDEYIFYDASLTIVREHGLAQIGANFFDGTYVYDQHPYIATLLQSLTFRLFDHANFGWRFANIAASAASVGFFSYMFHAFLSRRPALAATFFLAVSHYLMSFSRNGTEYTQALLAMGLALAAATWAIKSNRPLAFVALGASIAFCFYTFPSALYAPPLVLLLVLLCGRSVRLASWKGWLILTVTAVLLVLPLFFQADYWTSRLAGTVVRAEGGAPQTFLALVERMVRQFGYAFYSFVFAVEESHFVSVALSDGLTASLFLIGLGAAIHNVRREKFALFVVVGLALILLAVGASHQYGSPPPTRMVLLIPWFSLIAGLGFDWLAARSPIRPQRAAWTTLAGAGLCLLVLGLNFFQAYTVSPWRSTRTNPSFEVLFVRLAQGLTQPEGAQSQTIVVVNDPATYGIARLRQLLDVAYVPVAVEELVVGSTDRSLAAGGLLREGTVVVLSPGLSAKASAEAHSLLERQGLVSCELTPTDTPTGLRAWYSANAPSPCLAHPRGGGIGQAGWLSLGLSAVAVLAGLAFRGRLWPVAATLGHKLHSVGSSSRALAEKAARVVRQRRTTNRPPLASQASPPEQNLRRGSEIPLGSEPTDPSTLRALRWLLAGLILCAVAVFLLRIAALENALWPWAGLLVGMIAAGWGLAGLERWLPGVVTPAIAAATAPQGRRRLAVAAFLVAIGLTAIVILALLPDFRNEWRQALPLWLIAVALVLVGGWAAAGIGEPSHRAVTAVALWQTRAARIAEAAGVLLILGLAIFLRTYRFESIPPGVYNDETHAGIEALYLLEGRDVSPFGTGWYGTPNAYIYYMAGIFRLLGASWTSLKIVSLLPAILTIPAVYLLGRFLFGPATGLCAMALLAISRWHLTMSRWGWNETATPLLQTLGFLFLLRGLRDRRGSDYAISGLLVGLSLYTYLSARLAVVTFAVYLLLWAVCDPAGPLVAVRRSWAGFAIFGIAAVVAFAPLAVTYARDSHAFSYRLSEISVLNDIRQEKSLRPLVLNITDVLRFFHQRGDLDGKHNLPGEPMVDPVTGVLFVVGVSLTLFRLRDYRRTLLLAWIVIGMAGSYLSVRRDSPQAYRTLTALPAISLLAGDVLARLGGVLYRTIRERSRFPASRRPAYFASGGAVTLALTASLVWEASIYFGPQAASVDVLREFSPFENQVAREALAAIESDASLYLTPVLAGGSPVRFLADGAARRLDKQATLDDPAFRVLRPEVDLPIRYEGHDAVLLVDREYWSVRGLFARLYPEADVKMVDLSPLGSLFVRVSVPKGQLAALQGLRQTTTFVDGRQESHDVTTIDTAQDVSQISRIVWDGGLRIPKPGEYDLSVSHGLRFYLDGQPVERAGFLGRGHYHLRMEWEAGTSGRPALLWRPPDGEIEPVPADSLFRAEDARSGLLAAYWSNDGWQGPPRFQQVTPLLFFAWPDGEPMGYVGPFSARYTGKIVINDDGRYFFRLEADDGARLVFDGVVVGEGMEGGPNTVEAALDLTAGAHPIQVDFVQRGGSSALRLLWSRDGKTFDPVPPEALSPLN